MSRDGRSRVVQSILVTTAYGLATFSVMFVLIYVLRKLGA